MRKLEIWHFLVAIVIANVNVIFSSTLVYPRLLVRERSLTIGGAGGEGW